MGLLFDTTDLSEDTKLKYDVVPSWSHCQWLLLKVKTMCNDEQTIFKWVLKIHKVCTNFNMTSE